MKTILIIFSILCLGSGYAQNMDIPMQFSDRPAQYILGGKDILLININLWGHVQRPGIYSIPNAYSIIDLISSAGGPLKTARLNDIRIIRQNQQVIKVDIEQFIKVVKSIGDFWFSIVKLPSNITIEELNIE